MINGGVAGNYTSMQTNGFAKAGDGKAITNTAAQQVNSGGAITGGYAADPRREGTATGTANAWQSSQALGGSAAVAVTVNKGEQHGRGR